MSQIKNPIEAAVRAKLRFETSRGVLNVEQLFDVPLESNGDFSLDYLHGKASAEVNANGAESYVTKSKRKGTATAELQVAVLEHIIDLRVAEQKTANNRAALQARREQLLAAAADKQNQALANASPEEINAELAAIEAQLAS